MTRAGEGPRHPPRAPPSATGAKAPSNSRLPATHVHALVPTPKLTPYPRAHSPSVVRRVHEECLLQNDETPNAAGGGVPRDRSAVVRSRLTRSFMMKRRVSITYIGQVEYERIYKYSSGLINSSIRAPAQRCASISSCCWCCASSDQLLPWCSCATRCMRSSSN